MLSITEQVVHPFPGQQGGDTEQQALGQSPLHGCAPAHPVGATVPAPDMPGPVRVLQQHNVGLDGYTYALDK